jgi:hypothetical protein
MTRDQSLSAPPVVPKYEVDDASRRLPPQNVALGIVTYNNAAAQLERLLRSIEHAADRLDDAGHHAAVFTIDCGEPMTWPPARLPLARLPHQGNLGFGLGMNCLMTEAFADPATGWFLCVNPDGSLHHSLLREMIAHAIQYPHSLIEARQFPEEHPKPYDLNSGETLWASGACLLIPRIVYETIGGFDPNIFMYMEDVDYSWRARAAGFRVHVAARALFAHSVLDRKPNALIDKYCFFSARYLAYKWGRPDEQAFYEQAIRDRGFASEGGLPPLPTLDAHNRIPSDGLAIADFSHGFCFSPRRW